MYFSNIISLYIIIITDSYVFIVYRVYAGCVSEYIRAIDMENPKSYLSGFYCIPKYCHVSPCIGCVSGCIMDNLLFKINFLNLTITKLGLLHCNVSLCIANVSVVYRAVSLTYQLASCIICYLKSTFPI